MPAPMIGPSTSERENRVFFRRIENDALRTFEKFVPHAHPQRPFVVREWDQERLLFNQWQEPVRGRVEIREKKERIVTKPVRGDVPFQLARNRTLGAHPLFLQRDAGSLHIETDALG